LSRVAPTARKILVAGLVDRGYPTITHDELEGFRRKNGFAAFVETSSKTGEGIDDLRRELEAAIRWGELPATAPPELWDEFREFVMRPRSLRAALLKLSQLREIFRSEYSGHIFTDADLNQARNRRMRPHRARAVKRIGGPASGFASRRHSRRKRSPARGAGRQTPRVSAPLCPSRIVRVGNRSSVVGSWGMEAIKGGQKSIDSLFVRPRQWQLTAFRKNKIVSDWIGERSQSSKFAGGAIWCHLASPKHL